MKNKKFTPLLIIAIILMVIAIIIFIASLFSGDGKSGNIITIGNKKLIAPVIELSVNTSNENQEKVIITVLATTEDEQGIEYIVLPNGSKIFTTKKDYEVTENGKYEFKAVGYNGAEEIATIDVTNIKKVSANDPYIPVGFEHVSGEPDNGFIIKDQYGNEYVWVPVATGILSRANTISSEYEESDSLATSLVNSVAKNYGFYIARFEASYYEENGTVAAATIEGQVPWTNITYSEAYTASQEASKVFKYSDANTALINSYAWDTTLTWLNKTITNYSTNTSYGNYSGTIYPTGTTESDRINNICDMAGNVREWTTEIYKNVNVNKDKDGENILNRVIRGGSATINKIANSRNGYPENLTDGYWGFRTVLYKK